MPVSSRLRSDARGVIVFAGFVLFLTQMLTLCLAPGAAARALVPAASHPSIKPSLSISVSDGHTKVRPGDRLTYRVRVSDTGGSSNADLMITETMPEDARFVSEAPGGSVKGGRVAWHATLAAGTTDTFKLVVAVGRTPAHVLELASVACAQLARHGRPMICAAHLDKLPALAASGHPGGTRRAGSPAPSLSTAILVCLVVVTAASSAWLITGRRGRKGRRLRRSDPVRNNARTRRDSSV